MNKNLRIRKWIPLFIFISLLLIALPSCQDMNPEALEDILKPPREESTGEKIPPSDPADDEGNPEEVEPDPDPVEIQISAVGDIMVHSTQYKAQYDPSTDSYNFNNNFEFIKPYLENSHLALANLETTFAGRERGYSGYPLFNTPDAMASALKFAGFDIISTTNNHSLDMGEKGLLRTLSVLEEESLQAAGTRSTPEEKGFVIKDIEGIKVGVSAYTYETPRYQGRRTINGIAMSPELEKLIDSFGYETLTEDLQAMEERVKEKKEKGAELIIFYLHWGQEYQREPNSYQEEIAQALSDYGVDIIFGSHPHVIQPVEILEGEKGHQTLVVYSMGNFISNQRYEHLGTRYTEDGIIVNVSVKKDFVEDRVSLEEVSYVPTWVHRYDRGGRWVYEILPLVDALGNKALFNLNREDSIWRAQNSMENTLSILESRGIPVNLESPLPPETLETFK